VVLVALTLALKEARNKKMPLLNIVAGLIVVWVGLYLINRYIPMASSSPRRAQI
jgi:hypothetical protein